MIKGFIFFVGCYFLICLLLYNIQEKLLFHPTKLPKEFVFQFNDNFEEVDLKTVDGVLLNALHFKSKEKLGAVLFLHGNGGALNGWGQTSKLFTQNGYDVFYLDYRGYGKSGGEISSEQELIDDAQLAYDYLKTHFKEEKIIISGTSIGTGIATIIAFQNSPKTLILNSPYFSLSSLIKEKIRIVPKFLIKYKLETEHYINDLNCPVFVFHGDKDNLIPYHHSEKLKAKNNKINLTILDGIGHNNIFQSKKYLLKMKDILN